MLVDGRHELLVNLTAQNLAHDIHSRRRRYALAVFKLNGQIVVRKRLVDGFAATVHNHRLHAHDLEQDDIAHHVFAQLGIDHSRAAVLDDDYLSRQVFNPRQGLEEHLGGLFIEQRRLRIACVFHGYVLMKLAAVQQRRGMGHYSTRDYVR